MLVVLYTASLFVSLSQGAGPGGGFFPFAIWNKIRYGFNWVLAVAHGVVFLTFLNKSALAQRVGEETALQASADLPGIRSTRRECPS